MYPVGLGNLQVSLALALALSRKVPSLAASGAAKLESIFLDEVIGTLDETSLDVVATTLENLFLYRRANGLRSTTHVPTLAHLKIPVLLPSHSHRGVLPH